MDRKERPTRPGSRRSARALLSVILSVAAVNGLSDDRPLPWGGEEDDQSFVFSVGYHENGGRGWAASATYKHPIADKVKAFFTIDRVFIEDPNEFDLSGALVGISMYPWDNNVYLEMGVGAEKGGADTTSIFTGAVGYELELNRHYFIDIVGGGDWDREGRGRWAALIGIGKRF